MSIGYVRYVFFFIKKWNLTIFHVLLFICIYYVLNYMQIFIDNFKTSIPTSKLNWKKKLEGNCHLYKHISQVLTLLIIEKNLRRNILNLVRGKGIEPPLHYRSENHGFWFSEYGQGYLKLVTKLLKSITFTCNFYFTYN